MNFGALNAGYDTLFVQSFSPTPAPLLWKWACFQSNAGSAWELVKETEEGPPREHYPALFIIQSNWLI